MKHMNNSPLEKYKQCVLETLSKQTFFTEKLKKFYIKELFFATKFEN